MEGQGDPGKQGLPASWIFPYFSTEAQILSIVLFAIIKSKFSTSAEFNIALLEAELWGKLCFLYLSDTINR